MTDSGAAPLDWVIVGGGPIGVHVAVRLLEDGQVTPDRIRIVDPAPALLHRWTQCTRNTGMRFLRSPAVHHLDVPPFALLQSAGRRKRDRRSRSLFLSRYNRPSLAFFAHHCAAVIQKYGLADLHLYDRVEHIHPHSTRVDLRLGSGQTLRASRVVLALGNSDHPHWPAEAIRLRDAGGRVQHIFTPDVPIEPAEQPDEVAILGGGISAAQLAVRMASAGKTVTVLSQHAPREQQFDSDAGWIGPRYMRGFANTADYGQRRALIQGARHRGTMPPDVLRALRAAERSGAVQWRVGSMTGGTVREDGSMLLTLDGEAEPVAIDALILATGLSSKRPGGTLIDTLIAEHGLPVAACGYPVVDTDLRWHPRLFVTGPLAELELGPTARNLTGGRKAADRLLKVAQATQTKTGALHTLRRLLTAASVALLAVSATGCQDTGAPDKARDTASASATDTGDADSGDAAPLEPVSPQGNLLIEEVYYAGAVPAAGIDRYYSDQFIELVNIADAPVMVGGLIIGDAYGLAGAINRGDEPSENNVADPDYVYLGNAWRIPGAPEDVLLEPGASLVIAQDAGEHNPYSPIDLSDAHYETYVEESGQDLDDAFVPNLESLWYTAGIDWLVTVFGPTIVVLSMDADELEQVGSRRGPVQAPVSAVVDTMEALMDADSGPFKRLHTSVDSGFIHVSGTYTGESVRRLRDADGQLIDTNDSGADFEVIALPEPGVPYTR